MGQGFVTGWPLRITVVSRIANAARNSLSAQESMEVPVFANMTAMGVVVVLGRRLIVENVTLRIVVHLVKGTLATQALADDIEVSFTQHAMALFDFIEGGTDPTQLRAIQSRACSSPTH